MAYYALDTNELRIIQTIQYKIYSKIFNCNCNVRISIFACEIFPILYVFNYYIFLRSLSIFRVHDNNLIMFPDNKFLIHLIKRKERKENIVQDQEYAEDKVIVKSVQVNQVKGKEKELVFEMEIATFREAFLWSFISSVNALLIIMLRSF